MAPDQFGPLFGLIRYQLFKGRIVDEFVFTANQNGMNFDDENKNFVGILFVVGYTFSL